MAHARGADLGGVHHIDNIRARCRLCDESGCWIWTGAAPLGRGGIPQPRVWLSRENRAESLPRAVWLVSGRFAPADRWCAWRICGSALCANPEHIRAGTKAEWGRWVARTERWRNDPRRRALNTLITRRTGRSRLTLELATWIRESSQSGIEIAHALGVSSQVVSTVRRGRSWLPTVAAASVFSLASSAAGGAANGAPMRRAA